jgi:uncharacterized membrane protein
MYKIIGGDHKEYGPATAEELNRWIAEGRLSGQSLVQLEGSGQWKPLAMFSEFEAALQAQTGQRPGAAATPPVTASAADWSGQILERQPELRIGDCLGLSGKLLKENFGLLFAAAFLMWFISLMQFIPGVGMIYLLLKGVLDGGLCLVFLKRIRGTPSSVSEVFSGFSQGFSQLLLAGLVSLLLSGIGLVFCLVPGLFLFVAWTFCVPLVADKRLEFWSAMELSRKVVTRVWFQVFGLLVVAFLPYLLMYLFAQVKICLSLITLMGGFMTPQAQDFTRMMDLMTQVYKTTLPLTLLTKSVLFLNLPFALGALMYAYESLFGPRPGPRS